jgi:hypothetical protein
VPKLLGFLIIVAIGYVLAKVLSRIADRLLERVGFDRWVERGPSTKLAFERMKTDPSNLIGVVVFWSVFLIALQLAFGIFGPNPVSDLLAATIGYLPNLLVAVLILVIAGAVARVVTDVLSGVLATAGGGEWIARGAGVAVLVIGVFAALNQLEIAPEIVNGLFYAMLLIVVGSAIVAVGGGGIPTMRRYWERSANRLERTGDEITIERDPSLTGSGHDRR